MTIPRRLRVGYARFLAAQDGSYMTRNQFRDTVVGALGGRAAEPVVFVKSALAQGDDIEPATRIVRWMVTEFGMSERPGPVAFGR